MSESFNLFYDNNSVKLQVSLSSFAFTQESTSYRTAKGLVNIFRAQVEDDDDHIPPS